MPSGPGPRLAVIGGTGLTELPGFVSAESRALETPYGEASGPVCFGELHGAPVAFLARHGVGHSIPPHRINYRANVWSLREAGCTEVLGVAAVGGIAAGLRPGEVVVPAQLIDYTYGREHTFFDGDHAPVTHVDFTHPYTDSLRRRVLDAARAAGVSAVDGGVYGATQGPRLESAAEIDRMERDGCTLVGMTGMPEAGLAREAGLAYAHCAVVVNEAAGRGSGLIEMADIEANLARGMERLMSILAALARGA